MMNNNLCCCLNNNLCCCEQQPLLLFRSHNLSAAESNLLIERMTEQMVSTKEKFDKERRLQEMSLHARLSERKKKRLADLVSQCLDHLMSIR